MFRTDRAPRKGAPPSLCFDDALRRLDVFIPQQTVTALLVGRRTDRLRALAELESLALFLDQVAAPALRLAACGFDPRIAEQAGRVLKAFTDLADLLEHGQAGTRTATHHRRAVSA